LGNSPQPALSASDKANSKKTQGKCTKLGGVRRKKYVLRGGKNTKSRLLRIKTE